MSQQGPHYSPRSKLKPIIKAQTSGKLVTSGISDVAIASCYFEKTLLKKIIMILIIITSLKSMETRDELQLPAILCQDACQRLKLHPYITASRTIINIVLSYVEFRHWTLTCSQPCERGFVKYMSSPFYHQV